jgi:hypothetical protein
MSTWTLIVALSKIVPVVIGAVARAAAGAAGAAGGAAFAAAFDAALRVQCVQLLDAQCPREVSATFTSCVDRARERLQHLVDLQSSTFDIGLPRDAEVLQLAAHFQIGIESDLAHLVPQEMHVIHDDVHVDGPQRTAARQIQSAFGRQLMLVVVLQHKLFDGDMFAIEPETRRALLVRDAGGFHVETRLRDFSGTGDAWRFAVPITRTLKSPRPWSELISVVNS